MMRVYLDGVETTEAGQTLGEALSWVGERTEGRLVIEALADGSPVPGGDLADPPDRAPYAGTLEFRTADAEGLVRESLYQASESVAPLAEAQREIAELIESGRTAEGMEKLGEALGSWARVIQAVELARSAPGVEVPGSAAGVSLDELVGTLGGRLEEVRVALASEDLSGLADALGYDLSESAERWSVGLRAIADGVGGS